MGVMEDLEDLGEQQDTNINSEADPGVRSKVRESWRGLGGAGGEIWGRGFLGCQQGERRRERGREGERKRGRSKEEDRMPGA